MKRVLVTGGAGFIGSNLSKRLVDSGDQVTIVDDMSNGRYSFMPNGKKMFIQSSFDDKDELLSKIRRQEFDIVYHLAALPRVSYSVQNPVATNDVNVTRTLNLLNACRSNVERIVFASSSSVYGGADKLPTEESTKKSPKSPYALQKSIIEDYLEMFSQLYGLDSIALRFFNVYGPHALGNSPYATALAAWLTAIYSDEAMRSDGDGTQSRDLCYVDNVTYACELAGNSKSHTGYDVFNVACGESTTNKQVLDYLLKRYERLNARYVTAPWRVGDVMHTLADITKIKQKLGYEPIVQTWEGISRTCGWYDDNWQHIKAFRLRL